MPLRTPARRLAALLCLSLFVPAPLLAAPVPPDEVDLLITGGRVIDPAHALDAMIEVAVDDGRVVAIGRAPVLPADTHVVRTLDVTGHVVAPGFVDLHVHGQSDAAHDYQARDGVTTALELEWGYPEVQAFLTARRGASRVHYGASVSHGMLRALALAEDEAAREALRAELARAVTAEEPLRPLQELVRESFYAELTAEQEAWLHEEVERQLAAGGIGIGMAHAYYPGADKPEILGVFELAARTAMPIFTHVPGRGLVGVQEVVANAAATGAPLHVVHVNSVSLGEIESVLALIEGARAHGVDVSTEAYPYTAGSTSIQASLFDGDWQASYGIGHEGLQWQETGERLTPETFARYRETGGVVIVHMMKEEWVRTALGNDWVIVASDGMPYAEGAHPRTAGTFARILGRYVREEGLLDLPTAILKMSTLPAQRLVPFAPAMERKGQLGVGADADIVIFDPERVIDTATFETGPRFSEGIEYVFVGGVAVVEDGELVPDARPGQPVFGVPRR
jgi:N-acyl-D-aspartate/D-glutamate deacylase